MDKNRKQKRGSLLRFACPLIVVLLLMWSGSGLAAQDIPTAERQALVDLYNSTGGESWVINDNWLVGDPCANNWYGVDCNLSKTNVIGLYLQLIHLTGPIPHGLDRLTELTHLYLFSNNLTGPIPKDLANLTNLQAVRLYENRLTGAIPSEMGNLSNLVLLELHNNRLIGPIPAAFGGIATLTTLDLSHNLLSGAIPASLANLTETALSIHGNCLHTGDVELAAFLDAKDGLWAASQDQCPQTGATLQLLLW